MINLHVLISLKFVHLIAGYGWMDGWMTCNFTSFSTVFLQDDSWMVMKGCVQYNCFYGQKDFHLKGGGGESQTQDC